MSSSSSTVVAVEGVASGSYLYSPQVYTDTCLHAQFSIWLVIIRAQQCREQLWVILFVYMHGFQCGQSVLMAILVTQFIILPSQYTNDTNCFNVFVSQDRILKVKDFFPYFHWCICVKFFLNYHQSQWGELILMTTVVCSFFWIFF